MEASRSVALTVIRPDEAAPAHDSKVAGPSTMAGRIGASPTGVRRRIDGARPAGDGRADRAFEFGMQTFLAMIRRVSEPCDASKEAQHRS